MYRVFARFGSGFEVCMDNHEPDHRHRYTSGTSEEKKNFRGTHFEPDEGFVIVYKNVNAKVSSHATVMDQRGWGCDLR